MLSPNFGLDRIGSLAVLEPGTVMRLRSVVPSAGGKGANLARAALALGVHARVIGVLGGWIGRLVADLAAAERLDLVPVWVESETRVNTVVLEDNGRVTVLNEQGPPLAADVAAHLEQEFARELEVGALAVVIGSLPPGLPPELYAECVRLAHQRGRPVIVDAAREALAAVLPVQPDVLAPNVFEAEEALGRPVAERVTDDPEELRARALAAAQALASAARQAAIVKAGAAGAAVVSGGRCWFVAAPAEVAVRNPIGAGDAFVAGLVAALLRGASIDQAVCHAVAAGSASVETMQPGALLPERVVALLQSVRAVATAGP